MKQLYQVGTDLINGVSEDLTLYSGLVGALDFHQHNLIKKSGPYRCGTLIPLIGTLITAKKLHILDI